MVMSRKGRQYISLYIRCKPLPRGKFLAVCLTVGYIEYESVLCD